jgi:hypothetical protein
MYIHMRLARLEDMPILKSLIIESAQTLQAKYYLPAKIEGALGIVFGVDT